MDSHLVEHEKGAPDYDVTLLRLKDPVDFTAFPHIRPACLPTKKEPPPGCDVS